MNAVAGDYTDTTKYHQKQVRFKASRDFLRMPAGFKTVYFDTTECQGCKETLPGWRFLDDLLVTRVVTVTGELALEDSTDVVGLEVPSDTLTSLLAAIQAIAIERRAPKASVGEVQYWDDIRKKWWTLPDMSLHYRVKWASGLSTDSVLTLLNQVADLENVGAVEIPTLSSISCDNDLDPYVPTGLPSDSTMYHLYESVPGTDWIGVNAVCAWGNFDDGTRGAGVTVGILEVPPDTSHEDLNVVMVGNPWSAPAVAHGTATAGIIAAIDTNGVGVAGIAPDCRLMAFNTGEYYDEQMLEAIDSSDVIYIGWAATLDDVYTYETCSTAFARNCVLVAPTGNKGPTADPYEAKPASYDQFVIAVGYTAKNGTVTDQSNRACDTCEPWVDVVAPGTFIRTTYPSDSYNDYTGTSAAAAVVAGMVALYRSYDTLATPEVIESALEASADNSIYGAGYDVRKHGAGFANAGALIAEFQNGATSSSQRNVLAAGQSVGDTVRYLIVTNDSLSTAFEEMRALRHRRGLPADVTTTEVIDTAYSGTDMAEKIRACIRDYHDNHLTAYVLLGGDESVIPVRYAYNNLRGPGVLTPSDFYYACLDGDWNDDADTLYGELEDDVDLIPEVSVGRLPFNDATEVSSFVNKLNLYEQPTNFAWIERVVAIGSKLFSDGDGPALTEAVLDNFSTSFGIARLYDDSAGVADKATYFDSMNVGQGIVFSFTQAHTHGGNFFIRRESSAELIHWDDIDTLSNDSMPSLVFAATCFNNNIDSNCVAEHYIKHDFGGAIAYIGTSYNDFSHKTVDLAKDFFTRLFDSSSHAVGDILNLSRDLHRAKADAFDGSDRHTMFGYTVLGDPALDIWTESPESLMVATPAWLPWGLGNQSFDVTVSSGANPVESVLVCVSEGENIYELAYTNSSGVASFSTVSVPDSSEGSVFISASKHNFIPVDTSMQYTHCGLPGDINNNCALNLTDQTMLINYLFVTFDPLPIPNRGDVNTSCTVNLTDLTTLTNYLFDTTGNPPTLQIGCVTQPAGGRINPESEEGETIAGIAIDVVEQVDGWYVVLETDRELNSLSLDLHTSARPETLPTLLVLPDTTIDMFVGIYNDSTVKVGLIDDQGRGKFSPGTYPLLRVPYAIDISAALAVEMAAGAAAKTYNPVGVGSTSKALPESFTLGQNYPNPFNPSTTIEFALPVAAMVKIEIFNILGQRVRELVNEEFPAGEHSVVWDGAASDGNMQATGVYFYRLTTDAFVSSKKMLLLK
jgi:hypothetical protein